MIDSFYNFIVSLGSQPLYTPESLVYFRGLFLFSVGLAGLIVLSSLVFGLVSLIFDEVREFFSRRAKK